MIQSIRQARAIEIKGQDREEEICGHSPGRTTKRPARIIAVNTSEVVVHVGISHLTWSDGVALGVQAWANGIMLQECWSISLPSNL